ncbi:MULTISPECIES: UTRA domain-containing protein [unclassified Salinivibrio]|uniref:UTRA domain-containing protein n=1 Tax=unclassified Salinivibrio TaxID=2636825 RepID=UPI000986EF70|nr:MULTISPECIES: UTRA domain-containing protein [unclassified Salinivibrio]OOF12703.1 MFS transporter [Salinivibrio sp. PR919]OOF18082.1 MFS transporter [Salinivibrio sp. PR932]
MSVTTTRQYGTQLTYIKQNLREQIQAGVIHQGQKLPSERELSELYGTTRITVKDALVSLETEGLIYREERRGWYVSPERIVYNPLSRTHFHQMIREQDRSADTRLLRVRNEVASSEYARALDAGSMLPIHIIERLRYIDGRAVLFVENVLKAALFEGILTEDLTQSLTGIYRDKYHYETKRSRFEVIPTSAPAHVAKALNLANGQPILKICRINYKQDGELMDCEFEYWRPDAVVIRIDSVDPTVL